MSAIYKLKVNTGKITGTLTDFPAYLDLSNMPLSFWENVKDGGGDIRVYSDLAKTTELPREILSCDVYSQTGEIYTKVTSIADETEIYIYVDGTSSEPARDSTYGSDNVWTDAFGIYHFRKNDDDSSPFAKTGTIKEATQEDGYIDFKGEISKAEWLSGGTALPYGKATTYRRIAQSFTVDSVSSALTDILARRLSNTGSPTNTVRIAIQADSSGSPSGTNLTSKDLSSSVATPQDSLKLNWTSSTITGLLTAGVTYWLVYYVTASESDTNYRNLAYDPSGTYGVLKVFDGTNWNTVAGSLLFKVANSGYVDVGSYINCDYNDFSISFELKTAQTGYQSITSRSQGSSGQLDFGKTANSLRYESTTNNEYQKESMTSGITITDNTFHKYVLNSTPTSFDLYVDSVLAYTTTPNTDAVDQTFRYFGSAQDNNYAQAILGQMKNFKFRPSLLSAQISAEKENQTDVATFWEIYEVPTVSTEAVSDLFWNSGTANGSITDTGGLNATRRGFCYLQGNSGDPTIADSVVYEDGDFGIGEFSLGITGLDTELPYRVRAYAVNEIGISYGEVVDYTTDIIHNFSIKINDVWRMGDIPYDSFRITDNINQQVDQASFECSKFKPNLGEEIIVYQDNEKVFGGVVVRIETNRKGLKVKYQVTCKDFSQYLNRELITERFSNQTADQIIAYIISEYTTGFTGVNVDADVNITQVSFNRATVTQALDTLADLLNYYWYVDYDKDIHFFAKNTEMSPFNLDETSGNHNWNSLKLVEDFSQIRNQIYIVGGEYEADARTETYIADGTQRQFPLSYKFKTITAVSVNGVQMDVGIDGEDEDSNFDVLWSYSQKYIRFKDSNYPDAGDTISVTGTPLFPVIVKVPDVASIAEYGLYEYKIVDSNISSRDDAIARGTAELEAYSEAINEGSFETYTSGLRSGQVIHINVGDIDEDFVIQSVSMSMRSPNDAVWSVRVATSRTIGIIAFLQKFLVQKDDVKEGETLLELMQYQDASADTASVSITTASPPYEYDDAGSRYGFATWS